MGPVSKYPSLRMLKILILFVAVTSSISEVLSFEKREAQTQNCFGSNCNQNNGVGFFPFGFTFGRKKREAQTQNCLGGNCNQNNGVGFFPFGFPFGRKKREAQNQNCFGSNCNQNNGEGFVSGRGWGNIIVDFLKFLIL